MCVPKFSQSLYFNSHSNSTRWAEQGSIPMGQVIWPHTVNVNGRAGSRHPALLPPPTPCGPWSCDQHSRSSLRAGGAGLPTWGNPAPPPHTHNSPSHWPTPITHCLCRTLRPRGALRRESSAPARASDTAAGPALCLSSAPRSSPLPRPLASPASTRCPKKRTSITQSGLRPAPRSPLRLEPCHITPTRL